MKRILLSILMVLALVSSSFAATYYACVAGNIDAANAWEDAANCAGTTYTITGAFPAAGDILEANAQAMTVNVNPGPNGKVHLKNTAGGSFAAVTSVTPITINADVTAGTADCLTISGNANANPALTIIGNFTGSAATTNADAVNSSHTVGTVVIGSAGTPSTITGGGASGARGLVATGAGPMTVYASSSGGGNITATGFVVVNSIATMIGSCIGEVGYGCWNTGAGTLSLTGNCQGGDTSGDLEGCSAYEAVAGGITVTGNIIATDYAVGARGKIAWTPTAPSSGVTGHYVSFDGPGTAIFSGKNTDDATKALATFYYIDPTDGTSDQGSATSGGGAYGF